MHLFFFSADLWWVGLDFIFFSISSALMQSLEWAKNIIHGHVREISDTRLWHILRIIKFNKINESHI